MSEECITVRHVTNPFGVDATRLALYHVLCRCGPIISVDVSASSACVLFETSSAAQQAYLELNGFVLFGSAIVITIGTTVLAPSLESTQVSSDVTTLLFCDGADAAWAAIVLRYVRGVDLVEEISKRQCVIKVSSIATGKIVRDMLSGSTHPTRGAIVVHFLRRRYALLADCSFQHITCFLTDCKTHPDCFCQS